MDQAATVEQPSNRLLYAGAGACFGGMLLDLGAYALTPHATPGETWAVHTLVPDAIFAFGLVVCYRYATDATASERIRTALWWTIAGFAAHPFATSGPIFANGSEVAPTVEWVAYTAGNLVLAVVLASLFAISAAQAGPWRPILPVYAGIAALAFTLMAADTLLPNVRILVLGVALRNVATFVLGLLLLQWGSRLRVGGNVEISARYAMNVAKGWATYIASVLALVLFVALAPEVLQVMRAGYARLLLAIAILLLTSPLSVIAMIFDLPSGLASMVILALIYYSLFLLPIGFYQAGRAKKRSALTWQMALAVAHLGLCSVDFMITVYGSPM